MFTVVSLPGDLDACCQNATAINITTHSAVSITTLTAVNVTTPSTTASERDLRSMFFVMGIIKAAVSILGIVFNFLNIIVLSQLIRRRRDVSPTYHLLLAMGIADMMVLFFVGLFNLSVYTRWPPIEFYDLDDTHADYFHVVHYIWMFPANVFVLFSHWLVVSTMIFRFLAVAFPMQACQW